MRKNEAYLNRPMKKILTYELSSIPFLRLSLNVRLSLVVMYAKLKNGWINDEENCRCVSTKRSSDFARVNRRRNDTDMSTYKQNDRLAKGNRGDAHKIYGGFSVSREILEHGMCWAF